MKTLKLSTVRNSDYKNKRKLASYIFSAGNYAIVDTDINSKKNDVHTYDLRLLMLRFNELIIEYRNASKRKYVELWEDHFDFLHRLYDDNTSL